MQVAETPLVSVLTQRGGRGNRSFQKEEAEPPCILFLTALTFSSHKRMRLFVWMLVPAGRRQASLNSPLMSRVEKVLAFLPGVVRQRSTGRGGAIASFSPSRPDRQK